MTFTVESSIDGYIERTETPRPADGLWHPSSIFGCDRKALYEIRGVDRSDLRDARSRRILRVGSHLHEIIQRAVADDPRVLGVFNEVEIVIPELNVTGHADALLMVAEDEWELDEFKSINSRAFSYGQLPKTDHIEQARTYAYAIRHIGAQVDSPAVLCVCDTEPHSGHLPPLGDALKRIRITYVSKDDLKVAEFVLFISEEWEQKFEQKIARLERYRKDGKALPKRLPLEKGDKKNWLCGYCDWRTRCWEEDKEGIDL